MTDDELRAHICAKCGSLDVQHDADTSCIWDGEFNTRLLTASYTLSLPWPASNVKGQVWNSCKANALAYLRYEQRGSELTCGNEHVEAECHCDMRDLMSQGHNLTCAWRKD